LRTLVVVISLLFIVCITSGKAWSNNGGDLSVNFNIKLIVGMDGAELKTDNEGLVILSLINKSEARVDIPFICMYGKGGDRRLNISYHSEEIGYYAGFEVATIKYMFINKNGDVDSQGTINATCESATVEPGASMLMSLPIKAPANADIYDFKLIIDNRNLERAFNSHNFVNYKTKMYFNHKEITVNDVNIVAQ